MTRKLNKFIIISFLLASGLNTFSQTNDDSDSESPTPHTKGFHLGIFVGTIFANKYTANVYDGYGYSYDGIKNDFLNSAMLRKINYEYGGGNGQMDYIAQALNVGTDDWTFYETDMPVNLKYSVAFAVGAHMRYCFNNTDAVIFNMNASQINLSGNFTIGFNSTYISSQPPGAENYKTFPIVGKELRLLWQLGYQRILGDPESPINFFIEGGPMVSMAKFEKNQIIINSLQIDLTTFYDPLGYPIQNAKVRTGVSMGAFAGFGISLNTGSKWTMQLLYNPSWERIKLGDNHKFKMQHTLGVRGYYNF